MRNINETLLGLESYKTLINSLKSGITPVMASGIIDAQNAHIISSVIENLKRPALIVAENDIKAKEIYDDMRFFDKNTMLFKSRDIIFYSADVHSKDTDTKRLLTLKNIVENNVSTVVVSCEAIFDKILPPEILLKSVIKLKEGNRYDIEEIINRLVYMGYERLNAAESPGQFSVRGGILDIYPPVDDMAVRIEFWDDEIDSIRSMDPYSQRSVERIKSAEIYPVSEFFSDEKRTENAFKMLDSAYKKLKDLFDKKGLSKESSNIETHVGEFIKNKALSLSIGYINYFYEKTVNIMGYMPKDTIIFFCEPKRIKQRAENLFKEFNESVKGRIEKGYMLPEMAEVIYNYNDMLKIAQNYNVVIMSSITGSVPDFDIKDNINFEEHRGI